MQKWHKVKIILSENFFKHFFKKRKGTIYHQSLILQPLLENNINKNNRYLMSKFQINLQKFCKDCAKNLQRI